MDQLTNEWTDEWTKGPNERVTDGWTSERVTRVQSSRENNERVSEASDTRRTLEREVSVYTGAITTAQYAGGTLGRRVIHSCSHSRFQIPVSRFPFALTRFRTFRLTRQLRAGSHVEVGPIQHEWYNTCDQGIGGGERWKI